MLHNAWRSYTRRFCISVLVCILRTELVSWWTKESKESPSQFIIVFYVSSDRSRGLRAKIQTSCSSGWKIVASIKKNFF